MKIIQTKTIPSILNKNGDEVELLDDKVAPAKIVSFLLSHTSLSLSVLYFVFLFWGIIYESTLYSCFHINIMMYFDLSDYLFIPFKRPFLTAFSLSLPIIMIIAYFYVELTNRISYFLERHIENIRHKELKPVLRALKSIILFPTGPEIYRFMLMRSKTPKHQFRKDLMKIRLLNRALITFVVVLYCGFLSAKFEAFSIYNDYINSIEITLKDDKKAGLSDTVCYIGGNSKFVFVFDREKNSAYIFPVANINKISISSSLEPDGGGFRQQ
ncbi:MAG: hypothetical protein ACAI44_21605 [Candidatus Sericytochromatia bacterium]